MKRAMASGVEEWKRNARERKQTTPPQPSHDRSATSASQYLQLSLDRITDCWAHVRRFRARIAFGHFRFSPLSKRRGPSNPSSLDIPRWCSFLLPTVSLAFNCLAGWLIYLARTVALLGRYQTRTSITGQLGALGGHAGEATHEQNSSSSISRHSDDIRSHSANGSHHL